MQFSSVIGLVDDPIMRRDVAHDRRENEADNVGRAKDVHVRREHLVPCEEGGHGCINWDYADHAETCSPGTWNVSRSSDCLVDHYRRNASAGNKPSKQNCASNPVRFCKGGEMAKWVDKIMPAA